MPISDRVEAYTKPCMPEEPAVDFACFSERGQWFVSPVSLQAVHWLMERMDVPLCVYGIYVVPPEQIFPLMDGIFDEGFEVV